VEQYQDLQPDAVTLDLVMPEYDGLHALEGILGIDPDAKVVVVSALDQRNILKQAFKIGATDFLVKPFNNEVLVATLEALMPDTAPHGVS
jgi:two-component system chemotaxis response regulator CheY